MGKKEKALKVVLDTNVLVSALLFSGRASRLVGLWKAARIIPSFSKETFDEFRTVLSYPKFKLTGEEIKAIIEREVLPWFEIVEADEPVRGICSDPDDDKFLSCAVAASARYIVSGDSALREVGTFQGVKVITIDDLLNMLD